MKITQFQTHLVRGPYSNWVFVEITTSTGLLGLGEATVEGKEKTVEAAIKDAEPYLIGKDPHSIEEHVETLYKGAFWRGGPILNSAISGIDIALWDILGQEFGTPICQLLGGACRRKIRAYTWPIGNTDEEQVASAKQFVKEGFTAVKFSPYTSIEGDSKPESTVARSALSEAVRRVGVMREALGDQVDVLIDLHGRTTPSEAVRFVHLVEPYNPFFIEEPVTPENVDVLAMITHSARVPIATGERVFTKYGFRELLEKKACHIIQPDLCHAGGILECKKIAAMAEAYFVEVAPHNPLSPVATAACLQVDACIPNFLIQEVESTDMPWRERLVKNAPKVKDGFFEIPSKPGLGVQLNHDAIAERPYQKLDLPRIRREDGGIAEW